MEDPPSDWARTSVISALLCVEVCRSCHVRTVRSDRIRRRPYSTDLDQELGAVISNNPRFSHTIVGDAMHADPRCFEAPSGRRNREAKHPALKWTAMCPAGSPPCNDE